MSTLVLNQFLLFLSFPLPPYSIIWWVDVLQPLQHPQVLLLYIVVLAQSSVNPGCKDLWSTFNRLGHLGFDACHSCVQFFVLKFNFVKSGLLLLPCLFAWNLANGRLVEWLSYNALCLFDSHSMGVQRLMSDKLVEDRIAVASRLTIHFKIVIDVIWCWLSFGVAETKGLPADAAWGLDALVSFVVVEVDFVLFAAANE